MISLTVTQHPVHLRTRITGLFLSARRGTGSTTEYVRALQTPRLPEADYGNSTWPMLSECEF